MTTPPPPQTRSLRYKSIPEKRQNLHSRPAPRLTELQLELELELELKLAFGSRQQPSISTSRRVHVGIAAIWLIEISSQVLCALCHKAKAMAMATAAHACTYNLWQR